MKRGTRLGFQQSCLESMVVDPLPTSTDGFLCVRAVYHLPRAKWVFLLAVHFSTRVLTPGRVPPTVDRASGQGDDDDEAPLNHTLELARQAILHLSSIAARAGHYDLVASLTTPLLAHKVPVRKASQDSKPLAPEPSPRQGTSLAKLRKASALHITDPIKRAEAERDMEAIRVRRDALMARAAKAAAKATAPDDEPGVAPPAGDRDPDARFSSPRPSGITPITQASGRNTKSSHSGTWASQEPSEGLGRDGASSGAKRRRSQSDTRCRSCATSDTPEWRRGPDGPKTLCNSCGLHWAKKTKLERAVGELKGEVGGMKEQGE